MKYLTAAMAVLKMLALGLVCALLVGLCQIIWKVPGIIDHQANETRKALVLEIGNARADVKAEIGDALKIVDKQVSGVRLDVRQQVAGIRGDFTGIVLQTLDNRVAGIQGDAVGQMASMNRSVSSLVSGVNDTLKPIRETAAQVNAAAPDFLDCYSDGYGNANCLYNRYVGTSKAIEQAALAIGKEAPQMAKKADAIAGSAEGIAASVDTWVERLTAPQTLKQQLREWLKVFILAASRVI